MTETGYGLLQSAFPEGSIAIRAPFDLPSAVTDVIHHYSPKALILIETELWPNMLAIAAKHRVPVLVVNGRLSDKAFPKYRRTRWFWRETLSSVERFYMRSRIDAERMIVLGVDQSRVENAGSFKSVSHTPMSARTREVIESVVHPERAVWIAGSTRPGEEEILISAHRSMLSRHPRLQLWIAPRHPERFDQVAELIRKSELTCTRWSEIASGSSAGNEVLLIDQMGVLPELYECARIAFVGGSLKPFGGHNPMEPAIAGIPVVFGPHMDTQRESAEWLLCEGLASTVHNEKDIVDAVENVLSFEDSIAERARRAGIVRSQTTGVVDRVADDILRRISVYHSS
jgi:3-deoxy-D-manno-octulosonic-acid transferase